jgi:hypothetical protein
MKILLGVYCEAAHLPSKERLGKGCVLLHGVYILQLYLFFYFLTDLSHTYVHCTRINYKIVPVTSLNKYLHYGTSGTE